MIQSQDLGKKKAKLQKTEVNLPAASFELGSLRTHLCVFNHFTAMQTIDLQPKTINIWHKEPGKCHPAHCRTATRNKINKWKKSLLNSWQVTLNVHSGSKQRESLRYFILESETWNTIWMQANSLLRAGGALMADSLKLFLYRKIIYF